MDDTLRQEVVGVVQEQFGELRKLLAGDIATAVSASEKAQDKKFDNLVDGIQHSARDMVNQSRKNSRKLARMETKLNRALEDRDEDYKILHREIFGDPDERSGNPSIHEMLQRIATSINSVEARVAHMEGYERGAKTFVKFAAKFGATKGVSLLKALVVKLLMVFGAVVVGSSAAAFFMAFLFRLYQ